MSAFFKYLVSFHLFFLQRYCKSDVAPFALVVLIVIRFFRFFVFCDFGWTISFTLFPLTLYYLSNSYLIFYDMCDVSLTNFIKYFSFNFSSSYLFFYAPLLIDGLSEIVFALFIWRLVLPLRTRDLVFFIR